MTTTTSPVYTTVTITTNYGVTYELPCEPVDDNLAITPVYHRAEDGSTRLTGTFTVTHRLTGTTVATGTGCVECCRFAARALIATGVDWSQLTTDNSAEISRAWPRELKEAVDQARGVGWRCEAEDCCPWPVEES